MGREAGSHYLRGLHSGPSLFPLRAAAQGLRPIRRQAPHCAGQVAAVAAGVGWGGHCHTGTSLGWRLGPLQAPWRPAALERCSGQGQMGPSSAETWAGAEMPTGPDPWRWQLQVLQGTVLFDSSCYLAARSWLLCHSRACKTGCSLPPALQCPFPPFPQPLGPATLPGLQVPLGSPSQVCSHLSSSHLEARQQPPPKPPAPGSLPRPKIPPVRSWLKMQIPRSHQNCGPWDLHLTSSRQ